MNLGESPILKQNVSKESKFKSFLVDYVGEALNPEDNNVTVEMIIEIMAKEFPEFLLAVAEENWVRGYHQALVDVEEGEKAFQQQLKKEEDE
jgi:glucan biosynthesis protein